LDGSGWQRSKAIKTVFSSHFKKRAAAWGEKTHFSQINAPPKRVIRCRLSKAGSPTF
jgi:hypothetical protein